MPPEKPHLSGGVTRPAGILAAVKLDMAPRLTTTRRSFILAA